MAAEEKGKYFCEPLWLLFAVLSRGVYPNAECLAVFAALSLFASN